MVSPLVCSDRGIHLGRGWLAECRVIRVIRGLKNFEISEMSIFESLRKK